jgi:uncharacterized protein YbaP (TraB family)
VSNLTNFLRRALAGLGILTAASCAPVPQQTAEPAARPALWQIADADTKIYLFGTIHMLPGNYSWRSPAFDQAVTGSQELVVETILDDANPQVLFGEMMKLAFASGLPPITERVPAEKRPALEAAMAKSGVPRSAFDKLETWAAAVILLNVQFRELGLSGNEGVEKVLRDNFKQAGKPIDQLETNIQQLSFFDSLPENAQRALLEGAIEKPDAMRSQFNQMLTAWVRGNVDAIAKSFNQDLADSPELRDSLIRRRNRNWAEWIERRMAQPGTLMLAVGAGHLAGPDSVVDLLQRDGYGVRRVQ